MDVESIIYVVLPSNAIYILDLRVAEDIACTSNSSVIAEETGMHLACPIVNPAHLIVKSKRSKRSLSRY